MRERDQRARGARASRFPRGQAGAALLLLAACAGDPGEPDTGLRAPVAKDAPGSSGPSDAGGDDMDALPGMDASTPDAPAPDAAPPPSPDRDGDGIPDVVDPAPGVANRALFDDDFSTAQPAWLFTSAAMATRGGLLSVSETDGIVREGWLGPQPNWTDTVTYARVRVLRRGRSTDEGAGRFAVIARVQQVAPDRYLACGIDARYDRAFYAEHNGGSTAGRTLADAPLSGATGAWHDIAVVANANRIRCLVDGIVLEELSGLYSSGSSGVRSFDVAFEADELRVRAL